MVDRRLMLAFLLHLTVLSLALGNEGTVSTPNVYDVTTMAANNSTFNDTDADCLCDCDELDANNTSAVAPSTQEEAKKAASQLASELRLDRSNLSSTTRRKTSAPDHRPSAQGMGIVGVLVIVFVLGSVVALDFTVLVNDVKFAFTRLFGHPQGQPPYRCRVPRRNRRGLRRETTSTSLYGSPLAGSSSADAHHQEGGCGTRDSASLPGVGSDGGPDLRSRREMLLMHGIRHQ